MTTCQYALLNDGTVLQISHIENEMVYGDLIDLLPGMGSCSLEVLTVYEVKPAGDEPSFFHPNHVQYCRAALVDVIRWWHMSEYEHAVEMACVDAKLLSYAR